MAKELNLGTVGIRRVAVVGNATCCFADELNRDALDLQSCFDVDYAFDQVIIGVDSTPTRL